MRTDERGKPCPATLGEYRALCAELAPLSEAVAYLDREIARSGADHVVKISDLEMRAILVPRLAEGAGERPPVVCPCCSTEIVVVRGFREAQPGDPFLCSHCCAVSRFGPDLVLEPVRLEDLDPLNQALALGMQARIRAIRARRPN